MRGRKKLIILELARLSILTAAEIIDTITYYGYVETYRRMRGLSSLKEKQNVLRKLALSIKNDEWAKKEDRQNVYQLIYKLKRGGLIRSHKDKSLITNRGEKKRREFEISVQGYPTYSTRESRETIIVCFDIPEAVKTQRAWLRSALRNLNMKMHQRSLWIGKTILPEKFIEDMSKRGIIKYVDIFSIILNINLSRRSSR
jgi:hypothetical protein